MKTGQQHVKFVARYFEEKIEPEMLRGMWRFTLKVSPTASHNVTKLSGRKTDLIPIAIIITNNIF